MQLTFMKQLTGNGQDLNRCKHSFLLFLNPTLTLVAVMGSFLLTPVANLINILRS